MLCWNFLGRKQKLAVSLILHVISNDSLRIVFFGRQACRLYMHESQQTANGTKVALSKLLFFNSRTNAKSFWLLPRVQEIGLLKPRRTKSPWRMLAVSSTTC